MCRLFRLLVGLAFGALHARRLSTGALSNQVISLMAAVTCLGRGRVGLSLLNLSLPAVRSQVALHVAASADSGFYVQFVA